LVRKINGSFILLILLFITFCGQSLFAQNRISSILQAEHFTVEDGLSHRHVKGICQDEMGMMWFATAYGLNRFDGYEFKWYTEEKNGLSNNDIQHVHLDREGNVWVFSGLENDRAIDILNPITESIQSFEEMFGEQALFSLNDNISFSVGPDGEFAFLMPDKIVLYQDDFTEIPLRGDDKIPKGKIFFGKDELWLWVDAYEGKKNHLLQLREKKVVQEYEFYELAENYFADVFELKEDGGIRLTDYHYDSFYEKEHQRYIEIGADGKMKNDTLAEDLLEPYKISIAYRLNFIEKVKANYWVSSYDQSFWVIPSDGTDKAILLSEAYPELNRANYLFEDKKGAVWISTEFGVFSFQFKKNKFQNFLSRGNGVSGFPMRGLMVTGSGVEKILWGIVENQGELWKVDITTATESMSKDIGETRYALDKTRSDQLFFVTNKGIEQMDAKTGYLAKIYPHRFLETEVFTWKIHLDKYDKLWFDAAYNGTLYIDDHGELDSLTQWTGSPGEAYLYQFLENETDTAWLVTNKGLFRLNIKNGQVVERFWKQGEGRHQLPYDNIHHIWMEADYFWLATANTGLVKWHPNKGVIQRYTRADGLSNNTLYAAYPDDYGNIWLPSDYGINVLEESTGRVRTYTTQDGICHNEFNRLSHCRDEEGYLYFGTLDGITSFHPRDFFADTTQYQSPMVITNFQQFDGGEGKLVDKTAELIQTKSITLQPNDPLISLSFALLSYEQLDNVQYAYQIEGVDEDWTYQKENTLRLGRLPYGKYLLRIKGQAASGQWSAEELQIQMVSLRPYYLKPWFYITLIALLAVGFFLLLRYRDKSQREQRVRLESMVRERTATIEQQKEELQSLDELKSRFFANVSHELRTPLTLILGPLNKILKSKEKRSKRESEWLHFMHRNSQQLLKLVNEILDLSKLEKGKLEVEAEPVNFQEFLEPILAQFSSYAQSNSIAFEIKNNLPSGLNLLLDRGKVEKILYNYLSNALKFTPTGGIVTFTASEEGEELLLKVSDTGSGIPPEDLPFVFDRFFQTKQKNKSPQGGTGIGLSLAKELAVLMGGKVGVESEWREGSTFWVRLPKQVFEGKTHPIEVAAPIALSTKEAGEEMKVALSGEGKKLLLVEDNIELRQYLSTILSETYQIQTAENGQLAWELLKKAKTEELPDLIVSDVMMPVMDGIELIGKIKNHDLLCQIPMIMLTARADTKMKIQALRIGVDDYVTKPFQEEELLVRIANLLKNYDERRAISRTEEEDQPEAATALPTISQEDRNWLEAFEAFVQENISSDILSISYMATKFAMSESTFRRQVSRLTGLSPKQYLQEVRLDLARHLLENHTYRTVAQVADKAGFSNYRTFSRNYKDRFGKLPGAYLTG
jgi:signal transduction histidine kinase/DNA-binding response OmpR family regulator/ligand-binding sensor domain-containing protein